MGHTFLTDPTLPGQKDFPQCGRRPYMEISKAGALETPVYENTRGQTLGYQLR